MQKDRVNNLRKFLRDNDLDSFLILHPEGLRYFFGFSGSSGLGLVTGETVFFVTDHRYQRQAGTEVVADEVFVTEAGLIESISGLKTVQSLKRTGFDSSVMTFKEYESVNSELDSVLVSCPDLTSVLSAKKSEDELYHLKTAGKITVSVFEEVQSLFSEGTTEQDVAAEIIYRIRKAGGDREAFDPIVLFGERTSMPHGTPENTRLKKGDLIQLDFGAVHNGYCSDFSRVLSMGEPNRTVREIYLAVLDSMNTALEFAAVGVKASDVDETAREALRKRGFDGFFKHSLGHGIGIMIHTLPRISKKDESLLEPGNVFTIEPGVYIPGIGGIRLENSYHLTSSGLENLTECDLSLKVLE